MDFVDSNWKKVVTLKTEWDNLILFNFSNSTDLCMKNMHFITS